MSKFNVGDVVVFKNCPLGKEHLEGVQGEITGPANMATAYEQKTHTLYVVYGYDVLAVNGKTYTVNEQHLRKVQPPGDFRSWVRRHHLDKPVEHEVSA